MTVKLFNGAAASTTLNGGISSGATSIVVTDGSTYPAATFNIVIDKGLAGEEKVFVTSRSGNTFTVGTRGDDGTIASAHSSGAAVQHCGFAEDFQENNDHLNATAAHGATGAVVGTTNTQTLSNKTVALGSNTVSGTRAQFNTAMTDDDFATLTGTETLTNKTLTGAVADAASTIGGVSGTSLAADRTAWAAFSPTWTGTGGNPAIGNGSLTARYKQIGKMVYFIISLQMGSTTTYGSGSWQFTLPVSRFGGTARYALGAASCFDGSASSTVVGVTVGDSATTLFVRATGVTAVGDAAPFAWAVNDELLIQGTYEAL